MGCYRQQVEGFSKETAASPNLLEELVRLGISLQLAAAGATRLDLERERGRREPGLSIRPAAESCQTLGASGQCQPHRKQQV